MWSCLLFFLLILLIWEAIVRIGRLITSAKERERARERQAFDNYLQENMDLIVEGVVHKLDQEKQLKERIEKMKLEEDPKKDDGPEIVLEVEVVPAKEDPKA